MADQRNHLIEELRRAGISRAAIDAAWPSWWTDELEASASGRAELRFALARRLGLEPVPLLGERVEFAWNDEARFKHLSTEEAPERAALTSYGISVGRLLINAAAAGPPTHSLTAEHLRAAILQHNLYVDLGSLVATCWALGIPVAHLRVFPLDAKAMHAMVVRAGERHAILLGRDASYPAPIAFTLAHELGHVLLGHLQGAPALIDLDDPATAAERDQEERDADAFALTLLTGSQVPDIQTNVSKFNAPSLARAVLDAGPDYRIEPGTLALCLAYRKQVWPVANAALKFVYGRPMPVWSEINKVANAGLDWSLLSNDGSDFLRNVLSL